MAVKENLHLSIVLDKLLGWRVDEDFNTLTYDHIIPRNGRDMSGKQLQRLIEIRDEDMKILDKYGYRYYYDTDDDGLPFLDILGN